MRKNFDVTLLISMFLVNIFMGQFKLYNYSIIIENMINNEIESGDSSDVLSVDMQEIDELNNDMRH